MADLWIHASFCGSEKKVRRADNLLTNCKSSHHGVDVLATTFFRSVSYLVQQVGFDGQEECRLRDLFCNGRLFFGCS